MQYFSVIWVVISSSWATSYNSPRCCIRVPIRGGKGSHSKQEEGATAARRTQMKEMRQSSKVRRAPITFSILYFSSLFDQMQQKGGKGRIGTAAPLTPQQLEPFSPFPNLALAFLLGSLKDDAHGFKIYSFDPIHLSTPNKQKQETTNKVTICTAECSQAF